MVIYFRAWSHYQDDHQCKFASRTIESKPWEEARKSNGQVKSNRHSVSLIRCYRQTVFLFACVCLTDRSFEMPQRCLSPCFSSPCDKATATRNAHNERELVSRDTITLEIRSWAKFRSNTMLSVICPHLRARVFLNVLKINKKRTGTQ